MRKLFNNTYMRAGLAILAFGLVIALPALGFAAVLGGGAVSLAANITGPLSVDKIDTDNPEHLQKSMSKFITEIKPSYYALDTMIRKIGKKDKAIRPKHDYEEVTYRQWSTALNGAFTAAGSAADEDVTLTLDDASIFNPGDTLRVDGVIGASSQELRLLVTATGSSTISVTAINSTTGQRVLSIPDNTVLYRMAPGKAELDAQHTSNLVNPTEDYNYCQLFMTQMERSEMEQYTKSYSGFNYADRKRIALYDFRSSMEASGFFGIREITTDANGEKVYTADGVIPKISQTLNFGTGNGAVDPSINDMIDIIKQVYANTAGSESRVLFAGSNLIAGLDKIDNYDRNLQYNGNEIYHGVSVTRLQSSFGPIYVRYSSTLDQQGWQNRGVVLDLDHIIKAELEPLKATPLDLNKSGTRRVIDAVRITENCCLTTRYSGANGVHAILEPTA